MRVGVLGGGLQGSYIALALAERGVEVILFDKNDTLLSRTAVANEGKIHLCDCQFIGRDHVEIAPSIEGKTLYRMIQYIEQRVPAAPVRGLIRRAATRQAGHVRSDEFRAPLEVFVWLAKILRWGSFRRVAKPLYYRLHHPHSFTSEYFRSSQERMQAVRTTYFTGMLEAVMPLCQTPEQRLFFQQLILDRIIARWPASEPTTSEEIIAKCMDRLKFEMNTHLLTQEELSKILQQQDCRPR